MFVIKNSNWNIWKIKHDTSLIYSIWLVILIYEYIMSHDPAHIYGRLYNISLSYHYMISINRDYIKLQDSWVMGLYSIVACLNWANECTKVYNDYLRAPVGSLKLLILAWCSRANKVITSRVRAEAAVLTIIDYLQVELVINIFTQ